MLRLAIITARKRLGTYVGAFLALFGSAILVMAGGMLLKSALQSHAPVTRYAAAAAVVTGHQDVGPDHDVILGEPVRISSALVARLAAVPGVRAAIADDAVPGRLGAHDVQAHGWSSAQLAPYRLVAGRRPSGVNEVVTTFPSHLGARERLTSTEPARTVTVVGIAHARSTPYGAPLIFLTDSEAARLAGHPGRVDAIGILRGPGFELGRVRAAAGDVPGAALGKALARGFVRHGIAPADFTVTGGWLPATGAVVSGVAVALFAVLAAGRRASRVAPTRALADAAVEPRGIGLWRLIGGGIALAAAVPLFSVSAVTHNPQTAAATSEMNALFLVAAVGFLGPIVARIAAEMLRPALSAISPVGGFLAAANLRAATRRFSSASTPLVLSVALSCTLLFSSTTIDHAVNAQRSAGLQEDLAVTGPGAGLPRAALADVRATKGVSSAVAVTPTMLGPGGVGLSDDVTSAQVLDGGAGGGLDVGVVAGSLARLHGTAVALSRTRADAAHAHVGDRISLMLGDGTHAHATPVH